MTVLTGILIVVGCAGKPTPEKAYKKYVEHVANKEWGAVYDDHSSSAKTELDTTMKWLGITKVLGREKVQPVTNVRDLFIQMAETTPELRADLGKKDYQLVSVQNNGNEATLSIEEEGKFRDIRMVLENDEWKISGSTVPVNK